MSPVIYHFNRENEYTKNKILRYLDSIDDLYFRGEIIDIDPQLSPYAIGFKIDLINTDIVVLDIDREFTPSILNEIKKIPNVVRFDFIKSDQGFHIWFELDRSYNMLPHIKNFGQGLAACTGFLNCCEKQHHQVIRISKKFGRYHSHDVIPHFGYDKVDYKTFSRVHLIGIGDEDIPSTKRFNIRNIR